MKAAMLLSAGAVLLLSTNAAAQSRRPGDEAVAAIRDSYQAEHHAWLADFKRWQADHQRAEQTLRRLQLQLHDDARLKQHMAEIEQHERELARGNGGTLTEMAQLHAQQRDDHEEIRSAHNRVMADVAVLQADMDRDLGPANTN